MKVLVLGDDTRSFLAVVRSLGRQGIEVHVAPFNFRAPALSSRYIAKIHRIPPYVGSGESWCEAMTVLLERERFDLVLPIDDRTVLAFQKFRSLFEQLSRIAIPSDDAIEVLYDKHRTRELAERCRVSVPRGRLLRDDDSVEKIVEEFALPIVVKPRRSYRLDALHERGRVLLVNSEALLEQAFRGIDERGDYLVEAVFKGRGLGVSVLAVDGNVVYGFEHHRVTEVPLGGSSLRVSAPLDAERLAACQRMLRELPYTGVAMFEFRQDLDSGSWVLLEVNARFWGSLPLPLSLGVDFPYDLARALTGNVTVGARTYRSGVYCRNLFDDLFAGVQRLPRTAGVPTKILTVLRGLLPAIPLMLIGWERSDTFVLDDLSPGFADLAVIMREKIARPLLPLIRSVVGSAAPRRRRIGRALRQRRADLPLVFLCQGNICRSPFAHQLLQREQGKHVITVPSASAGLLPLPGRRCPDEAVRAAREYGIDLTGHLSSFFDESWLATAELIFVFDRRTLEDFRNRYPDSKIPVFLLTDLLAGRDSRDIEDPMGHSPEVFASTYARIDRAMVELTAMLREHDAGRTKGR